jgi:hypothetical protein
MATLPTGHFGLCAALHVVKVFGRGHVVVLTPHQVMAAQIVQERFWMWKTVVKKTNHVQVRRR